MEAEERRRGARYAGRGRARQVGAVAVLVSVCLLVGLVAVRHLRADDEHSGWPEGLRSLASFVGNQTAWPWGQAIELECQGDDFERERSGQEPSSSTRAGTNAVDAALQVLGFPARSEQDEAADELSTAAFTVTEFDQGRWSRSRIVLSDCDVSSPLVRRFLVHELTHVMLLQ